MTNLTDFTSASLPPRNSALSRAKQTAQEPQETAPAADFALLLDQTGLSAITPGVSEELAEVTGSPPTQPAGTTGNILPLAGNALPVGGQPSAIIADDAQPDEPAQAHRPTADPANSKPGSASLEPPVIALKAVEKVIEAAGGQQKAVLPFMEQLPAEPKQPAEPVEPPGPNNAARHAIQLLRPIARDRLTVVSIEGEQIDAPSLGASAEAVIRPILPVSAADNISLGIQYSGQQSGTLIASHNVLAAPLAAHDFEGMIDRLVEARQAANSGRAQMAVRHDEFGTISIRLEHAATGMKLALSSVDASFAPAVQSALAARAVAERADIGELLSGNDSNDRHSNDARAFGHDTKGNPQSNPVNRATADDAQIHEPEHSQFTRSSERHETGLYA